MTEQTKEQTIKTKIEAAYKALMKSGKVNVEALNQAVIDALENPETLETIENPKDFEKALKHQSKLAWRKAQYKQNVINKHELFIAEHNPESNETACMEFGSIKDVNDIERTEMIIHLKRLLNDEMNSKIFDAYYVNGLNYRQIEAELKINIGTISRRLAKIANIIDKSHIRRLYADAYLMAAEKPAGMEKIRMQQKHDTSPAFDRLIDITDADAMEVYQAEKKTAAKAAKKAAKKAARAAYRHVSSNAMLDRDWYDKNIRYVEDYEAFTEFGQAHITRRPQASNDGTMMMMQSQANPINFVLVDKA